MDEYQLSETEIAELKLLHRTLKKKRESDRVKAVIWLASGMPEQQVAKLLFLDCDTVKNYFARYQQLGKDDFYQLHYASKEPYLTLEQQEQFAQYVEVNFNLRSVDFAAYYKSRLVKAWLRLHKRVNMHFLPAYSPSLNVWKFFKKKILYNRYYAKYAGFVKMCKNFFRCRKSFLPELETLFNENFHIPKSNEIQNG